MANIWNKRRRTNAATLRRIGDIITKSQLIEILRKRGLSRTDIEQIVSDLPFGEMYLIDVRFDGGEIHAEWKPKKLALTAQP